MNKKLLDYFNGDELAMNVWQSKYAQDGEETPDDMHRRLAKEFAMIDSNYQNEEEYIIENNPNIKNLSSYGRLRVDLTEDSIYNLFKDFKYIIPQGSIMSQLGSKSIGSLSNCFVIGSPYDSYGGIFQKDEELVQLMKRRGGVGIDISTLRPSGTATTNAAKTSTGAVSFMHRFSNSTNEVAQNGRRGALMLSIDINHPDVMEFIKIKRDNTSVTGANISIKVNNEFMKAVKNDEDYVLRFPCDTSTIDTYELDPKEIEYNKLYEVNGKYFKYIKAREYWDEIIKSAHGHAEPGIIFEDNHHNYSPDGVYPQFKGVTTNPCGEIFMQAYDACRLIAVNLYSFVDNPFTDKAEFNFKKFYEINYEAMRLSDDLIDLELEHIDKILDKLYNDVDIAEKEGLSKRKARGLYRTEIQLWENIKNTAMSSRRTGLGFTALGDTLAALNLKYDSKEGLNIIDAIMCSKMTSELDCTIDLAILRGTFKGWDDILEWNGVNGNNNFYKFISKNFPKQFTKMMEYGRRNVSWNTVAPTGTVSLLAQTTSGVEPLFQPFYIRRKKVNNDSERVDFVDEVGIKWQEFPVLHPKFAEWCQSKNENNTIKFLNTLSKEVLQELFEHSPWYKSTANDIDWVKRVEIQSIIQKYITHSISSTINLPNDVTEEEVAEIYLESWKKGLKGITVYRDGSRSGVLVTESTNKSRDEFEYIDAVKRPKVLECKAHTASVKGQKYNIFIGLLNNKPYEVFVTDYFTNETDLLIKKVNKGRYDLLKDESTHAENIETEMSDEQEAITRLVSTSLRHGANIKFIVEQLQKTSGDMFSFTKALSRVLKKYIPDGEKSSVTCRDCGSDDVVFEEGCNKCRNCGSSACG